MLKWFVKKINNKKGFTMVELIVVIAILGILAAVAVPKFSDQRKGAADAADQANIRTLQSAANMAVAEGTTAVKWSKNVGKSTSDTAKGWENYLQEWPVVPAGGTETGFYQVDITGDGTITVTHEATEPSGS